MAQPEMDVNPWKIHEDPSPQSKPRPRIHYILGDRDKLIASRQTPTIELQLERELSETSDAFILMLADEIQQVLDGVQLKYVFSGCLLVGFEIEAGSVGRVQTLVDEGALDALAHVFDFSAVTFFKCDTAIHRVVFK